MVGPEKQEPCARWFGRNENDPNALLIIEDEQSRIFLDTKRRMELYKVIEERRSLDTCKHPPVDVLTELDQWAKALLKEQEAIRDNGRYVHPRIMQANIDQVKSFIEKIAEIRQQEARK